jgi:hypothetical protein
MKNEPIFQKISQNNGRTLQQHWVEEPAFWQKQIQSIPEAELNVLKRILSERKAARGRWFPHKV